MPPADFAATRRQLEKLLHRTPSEREGAPRIAVDCFIVRGPLGEFFPRVFESPKTREVGERIRREQNQQSFQIVA